MKTITENEFRIRHGDIHQAVFTGKSLQEGAFSDPTWTAIWIVDSHCQVGDYWRPLAYEAKNQGDKSLVMVDESGSKAGAMELSWDPTAFKEARFRFALGVEIFGSSGTWGAFLTDSLITCLGGSSYIMDPIVEALGGRGILDADFERWTSDIAVELLDRCTVNELRVAAGLRSLPG